MDVILCGAAGRMGRQIATLLKETEDMRVVASVDKAECEDKPCYRNVKDVRESADVILDFSHHGAIWDIADFAEERSLPLVVATTAHTKEEKERIYEASKSVPVFFASNFSLGLYLVCEFAKRTASVFENADVEIVETHHFAKSDVPSGSALSIANAIKQGRNKGEILVGRRDEDERIKGQICISSLRLGGVFGKHKVIFDDGFESVSIEHAAHSREVYAYGAVRAMRFIVLQKAGLYGMKDMV